MPEGNTGGGRSGRGPATHVPGEQEPGGLAPPYEGRKTEAEIDESDDPEDAKLEGAKGPTTTTGGKTSPEPSETPGGATASPADEQPAEQAADGESVEEGSGPAHVSGTPKGERGGT
jgi:hypothetical protein